MTSVRESRYRRALLFYPKRWRDRNADVVLSTLLDVADAEGRRSPRASELLQLAASGLSTRLALYMPQAVRDAVSAIALATGVVLAVAFATVQSLPVPSPLSWGSVRGFGPFLSPGIVIYALWLVAFLLAVCGARRVLRLVLVVALFAPAAVWITRRSMEGLWAGPSLQTLVFFTVLAVLALLGTPRLTWRTGIGMLVGAGALVIAFGTIGAPAKSYMDEGTFWRLIASLYTLSAGFIVALIVALVFGMARRGDLAHKLGVSLLPWIAAACVSVVQLFEWDGVLALACLMAAAVLFRVGVVAFARARGAPSSGANLVD